MEAFGGLTGGPAFAGQAALAAILFCMCSFAFCKTARVLEAAEEHEVVVGEGLATSFLTHAGVETASAGSIVSESRVNVRL